MALNPIENAFGKLTSRTVKNTDRLTNNNRQRRYLVSDDMDKEYATVTNDGVNGEVWLSISQDMTYIERWEFKLIIQAGSSGNPQNLSIILDGIDLTDAFKVQFPGEWITGIGMFPDTTPGNRYNILEALLTVSDSERSSILSEGYHLLEFKSDGLINLKVREFKKYSFINRQGGSHGGASGSSANQESRMLRSVQAPISNPKLDAMKIRLERLETDVVEERVDLSRADDTIRLLKLRSEMIQLEQQIIQEEYISKVRGNNGSE